ncbi:LacI family DNA-binding transcriptional regulator [Curtobacterium pusillum]|uniref:LacI family DNA-binding transcriptional regulator n=1 Tax=Curtobacterium pusillum TaxID=69373 RepID=A0ABX2MDU4_9MICO|nr:LacI family DNA-binding transcriptional regulator [Curtobacterium pusillum]NUU13506.1 LacI family DNA-binding transcriptional regulator [Curtobacterium pusillum]GLK29973.1 LacI family transcriptional regulator [Curtobacterium pusillum]
MERRPTITDVARHAGVSKGLVSLALNDRPGVNADTRARIRSAADDIGWRPNAAARSLTSRRTSALGLVVTRDPSIIETDPFFAAFIAGLEAVLSERGQVLVLSVVPDADAEERTYRTLAGDGRVDGFIITDLRRADPRVALVAELGSVAVTLGEPDVPSPFPAVRREYEHGIDDLVHYLADLGHTRIAHVAGNDDMLHGHARREQFERTAEALGVRAVVTPTDFSPEAGASATEDLLGTDPRDRPTAIVYGNDPMAIAGMAVAQRLGFRVPDDVSISGLDGSQIGRHVYPALTTLDNDPAEWGRVVAATLLDLVDGKDPVDRTLTPARLIVRGSTGAPLRNPA